jgi:hypothetical protein
MEKKEKKKGKKVAQHHGVVVDSQGGACVRSICKAHQIPERTTRHTTVAHVVKC